MQGTPVPSVGPSRGGEGGLTINWVSSLLVVISGRWLLPARGSISAPMLAGVLAIRMFKVAHMNVNDILATPSAKLCLFATASGHTEPTTQIHMMHMRLTQSIPLPTGAEPMTPFPKSTWSSIMSREPLGLRAASSCQRAPA